MGAYQVSRSGDFANWKIEGQKGGGIGGAMDLAACAKRVFIILEQTTRNGAPRLVEQCELPVTARGVVKLVATNYGLFEPTGDGFRIREIAPAGRMSSSTSTIAIRAAIAMTGLKLRCERWNCRLPKVSARVARTNA